ncbi:MAG: hypothetical protein QM302_07960 [Acidobacteriota bacterium]|nr:hypothetical protein [Acidobacteriota bacterium]
MFSASTALLAFLVGIVGSIFGGTQTFIVTGFVGLFVYALKAVGIESEFLSETLMNTVFLPAIIFNAAAVSTAYAARHHDIEGWDITHSLLFTHDPVVPLLAGLGGVAGYLVFAFARGLGLPIDQGSVSVILIGVLTRALLGHGHWVNPNATAYYQNEGPRYWAFQFVNALGVCGLTALVLQQVDPSFYNIVFNVSAALILLSIFDRQGRTYPTTHHETLVVAYAMAATGANVVLSVAFGMLSNLIYLLFARYFNENCDTHIDPPAVAIAICSLVLFTCF